jgi:hypothetical protein
MWVKVSLHSAVFIGSIFASSLVKIIGTNTLMITGTLSCQAFVITHTILAFHLDRYTNEYPDKLSENIPVVAKVFILMTFISFGLGLSFVVSSASRFLIECSG